MSNRVSAWKPDGSIDADRSLFVVWGDLAKKETPIVNYLAYKL